MEVCSQTRNLPDDPMGPLSRRLSAPKRSLKGLFAVEEVLCASLGRSRADVLRGDKKSVD